MLDSIPAKNIRHQDAILNNLAWVIQSPPIIQGNNNHCHWAGNTFWQHANKQFATQSASPNPLALHQLINKQTDHRLGHYFETLINYWFTNSTRYQLLAQNLQVHDGKQTIGEFDFIVHDRQENKTQHWEVACKFYLGIGNTKNIENWHGPMLKDKLVNKYQKMQAHQSKLSEHPVAQSLLKKLSIHIDQKICLMKGRLFYPLNQEKRLPLPSFLITIYKVGGLNQTALFNALKNIPFFV